MKSKFDNFTSFIELEKEIVEHLREVDEQQPVLSLRPSTDLCMMPTKFFHDYKDEVNGHGDTLRIYIGRRGTKLKFHFDTFSHNSNIPCALGDLRFSVKVKTISYYLDKVEGETPIIIDGLDPLEGKNGKYEVHVDNEKTINGFPTTRIIIDATSNVMNNIIDVKNRFWRLHVTLYDEESQCVLAVGYSDAFHFYSQMAKSYIDKLVATNTRLLKGGKKKTKRRYVQEMEEEYPRSKVSKTEHTFTSMNVVTPPTTPPLSLTTSPLDELKDHIKAITHELRGFRREENPFKALIRNLCNQNQFRQVDTEMFNSYIFGLDQSDLQCLHNIAELVTMTCGARTQKMIYPDVGSPGGF